MGIVKFREFEIEVGSPAYERLVKQGEIQAVTEVEPHASGESVAELRARLDEAGVEAPSRATKAQLEQLLEEHMQENAAEGTLGE